MLRIDTNFPGGSLRAYESHGDVVNVAPGCRGAEGAGLYWAFRLSGAAGRALAFHFAAGSAVGVRGPALSTDGMASWRWTSEAFDKGAFLVSVPQGCDEIYLAAAPLYTQGNWGRFLSTLPGGAFDAGFFARSRKGRPVELLHAGAEPGGAKCHVVVAARHRGCETVASYVLEGIAAALLACPGRDAAWLRGNASFSFVPFVDKDGVEEGGQGGNRLPLDHARDYGRRDHLYPETAAVAQLVKALVKRHGKLDLVIDLHCPGTRGGGNGGAVGMVGVDAPGDAAFRRKFGRLVQRLAPKGSLPYFQKDDIPYGTSWNTGAGCARGLTLPGWAGRLVGVKAAAAFQIPYADVGGAVVTAGSARLLGVGIARAAARYLNPGQRI